MRPSRSAAVALGALLVLGLTACVPSTATPTPTGSSTGSGTPTPDPSDSAGPTAEPDVQAAIVLVTASGISVFATDGSTLATETYRTDAATVAAHLAEALGEEPTVTHLEAAGESCPANTTYGFGGLELATPGGLGSAGFLGSGDLYDAYVSGGTTAGGISIETVAGQHIGSARSEFEAAVGDEVLLDDSEELSSFGFNILNPEAGPYEHIGVQAWFDEDGMSAWLAPAAIGFIGDCG